MTELVLPETRLSEGFTTATAAGSCAGRSFSTFGRVWQLLQLSGRTWPVVGALRRKRFLLKAHSCDGSEESVSSTVAGGFGSAATLP